MFQRFFSVFGGVCMFQCFFSVFGAVCRFQRFFQHLSRGFCSTSLQAPGLFQQVSSSWGPSKRIVCGWVSQSFSVFFSVFFSVLPVSAFFQRFFSVCRFQCFFSVFSALGIYAFIRGRQTELTTLYNPTHPRKNVPRRIRSLHVRYEELP